MSKSKLSLSDKTISEIMEFHLDPRKKAAAMEFWGLIHIGVTAALLLFTDWILLPVLLVANALVIAYQRYKVEKHIVALEARGE